MAAKKALKIQEAGKRAESFLNTLDPEREWTRQIRYEELSNGDVLDFYRFRGQLFLIQRFQETGGIGVYVNVPGNGIAEAADYVRKTALLEKAEPADGLVD